LEYPRSDIIYIPLRDEVTARIQATTEIVGHTSENAVSATHVEKLNGELIKAKLTGEMVQLFSPSMIWTSEQIDETGIVIAPVYEPELLDKRAVTGIFMGVGEMEIDQQRTLVYQLSVGFDDETMTSRSVIAPVDESTLLVGTVGSAEAKLSQDISESVHKLSTIENPKFREVLKDFVGVLEDADQIDAVLLGELGVLSTWMMAQDGVRDDIEMRQAIGGVIGAVLADGGEYRITGQEFVIGAGGEIALATVRRYEGTAEIHGLALTNDYGISKDSVLTFENTMQPSIVIIEDDGKMRYIPLKAILEFSKPTHDERCRSSMQRFITQYPNVFKQERSDV